MHAAPLSRSLLLALLTLGLACSDSQGPHDPALLGDLDGGPVFLVQSEPATAVMEALFDGRVLLDPSGCPRLDVGGPEDATVVWPYGATLVHHGGTYVVRDAEGREVGVVGERFRFGGGYVPRLHDGIPMNVDARARAEAQCPGVYWIVGEIP